MKIRSNARSFVIVAAVAFVSCGPFNAWNPRTTITEIIRSPSIYADSLVTIADVTVLDAQTALNLSRIVVADGSGNEMVMIDNKPHVRGEDLGSITGRYQVLLSYGGIGYEVFVSEGLQQDLEAGLKDHPFLLGAE